MGRSAAVSQEAGWSKADLALGCSMALLAGATDVYGLTRLGDLFVSFMSGNTTMLGVAIGHGDWPRAALIAGIVGCFVAGAALGTAIGAQSGERARSVVVFAVGAILAVPLLHPGWTVAGLVVAMGVLNAAMNHVGAAPVSLTYVTGALVKLGQGIGRAVSGRPGDATWILQLPLWLSLLAGAILAVAAQRLLGPDLLWPLPSLTVMIAAMAALHEARSRERY